MNPSTKQKQTHRYRTDMWLPRGKKGGEGWIGSMGLADANYLNNNFTYFWLCRVFVAAPAFL